MGADGSGGRGVEVMHMVRVGGWKVCGRCVEDVGLYVLMKINIKFTENSVK